MNLGITFEEKALKKISLKKYLETTIKEVDFIELGPNFTSYDITFYKKVINEAKKINQNLHFHVHLPHFHHPHLSLHKFNFLSTEYFFTLYNNLKPLISLTNKPIHLIFHGANYEQSYAKALKQTCQFIEISLNHFKKHQLPIVLALETLNGKKQHKIGESEKSLLTILQRFPNENVGICWDLIHTLQGYPSDWQPSKQFLDHVIHYHIHGFADNKNHLSLKSKQLIDLKHFKEISNTVPVTFEMLNDSNYLTQLSESIHLIKEMHGNY